MYCLTMKELNKYKTITEVIKGYLKDEEASSILKLSERQIYRSRYTRINKRLCCWQQQLVDDCCWVTPVGLRPPSVTQQLIAFINISLLISSSLILLYFNLQLDSFTDIFDLPKTLTFSICLGSYIKFLLN